MTRPTCTPAELDKFLSEQASNLRRVFVADFRARFKPESSGVVFSDAARPDPFRAFLDTLNLALDVQEPTPDFVVIAYTPPATPRVSDTPPFPSSPNEAFAPVFNGTVHTETALAGDRDGALMVAHNLAVQHPAAHIVIRRGAAPCPEVARFAPLEPSA